MPIPLQIKLTGPLFAEWSTQPARLYLAGVAPGTPLAMTFDGVPAPFQYTGLADARGAEVFVLLGFAKGQKRVLEFNRADKSTTDLTERAIAFDRGAIIGAKGFVEVGVPAPVVTDGGRRVVGPFASAGGWPMEGAIYCDQPFESAGLACTNSGPLFEEFCLEYRFAQHRRYKLTFRFWRHEPMVEVAERFSLGMNATLSWTINPALQFDKIISRDSFEGESQPTIETLADERVRDVLCRLQMPVLTEYFIPNNRGWFSFYDSRNESRGMLGILGLYGDKWMEPVANMPELFVAGGKTQWNSSLASGSRHWLLYSGPVETKYTPAKRFVFHRLHAEFNQLRLDEHLDLTGETCFDSQVARQPGMFPAGDIRAEAKRRVAALAPLRIASEQIHAMDAKVIQPAEATFLVLCDPSLANRKMLFDTLLQRFERWVWQFQGWRDGRNDYMKNVIGFARYLRGMLVGYELLCRDNALTPEQSRMFNAYFVFCARRITDEGRWPHSRTPLHPDHPESARDFYTYGGEHRPDRIYWTNCLPNFQSDPLCALAHIAALFPDHPDAQQWLRKSLDDIDGQLDAYAGKSGAWEESIIYILHTFSYWVVTFQVLKSRLGIDYFNDERVRRVASWLVRFFGPIDKRFGSHTWPGIGNSRLPQNDCEFLYAYAGALAEGDPLREQCIAIFQLVADKRKGLGQNGAYTLAAMAPVPDRVYKLDPVSSEWMDEIGVAMRDKSRTADESYLFEKIGFAKDHYEADETAINWYAKGTPLCMEYATYTGDMAVAGAHNLVEIPDADPLRRGYLKSHVFTPVLDYTHCEVPVALKLLWGRVRSFAEVEDKDGIIAREKTPYFYIGDKNPLGPKTWKVRLLLFVKPDYIALFDRVYGDVPHRYNLHVVGTDIRREANIVRATGKFDLDLACLVQHPSKYDFEKGHLTPKLGEEGVLHGQDFFRITNREDGIYRTLLFAKEKTRSVQLTPMGRYGMKVVTPEYTDYVFLHDDPVSERGGEATFEGRSGWIRKTAGGQVQASILDGDQISAFGYTFTGRGPWSYNADGKPGIELHGGPARNVAIKK